MKSEMQILRFDLVGQKYDVAGIVANTLSSPSIGTGVVFLILKL